MTDLTVKDPPDSLCKKLKYRKPKSQVHADGRSIASEGTVLPERALAECAASEEDRLHRAKRLRDQTPTYRTEDDRQEALRRGRARREVVDATCELGSG